MKSLMVLASILAVMLAVAVPAAFAQGVLPQGGIKVTGVLYSLPSDGGPAPYGITDEATGERYILEGAGSEIGRLEGQRTYVEGVPRTDPNTGFNFLEVNGYTAADRGGPPGPPPGEEFATLSFELTVEGEPPADATFFGNVQMGEGGPGSFVPLTDPDGDGLYTGTTRVNRFGPGPRPVPPGVEPLSFGVRIVQGTGTRGSIPGEPSTVIKDFGAVPMNDQTFSASISYEQSGGSGNSGSSGSGSKARELPKTGGAALVILDTDTLLVASGLLARRANR